MTQEGADVPSRSPPTSTPSTRLLSYIKVMYESDEIHQQMEADWTDFSNICVDVVYMCVK